MTPPRAPDHDEAPTVVRLPLLPSPDEMQEMRAERTRLEERFAGQVRDALDAVAICAQAVGLAGSQLDEAVRAARAAGASWVDVGRAVGISRQAAAQRWERKP